MNGPQHYAEAERMLKSAHQPGKHGWCTHAEAIAQAQVHATLALAAATVDMTNVNDISIAHADAWVEVTR